LVFAAGGIGLPPLRPAIVTALARRERYGRLVVLYGGRTPEQLLYRDELAAWSERGAEVMMTVDSAGREWVGDVGVVTRLVGRAGLRGENTVAMCCGPEVMMRLTAAALEDAGVCAHRLFASVERNMQCGIASCGHCQLGPTLVCRDGPVYRWAELERWLAIREL
jgi:NAD(P)H-flavin reductase